MSESIKQSMSSIWEWRIAALWFCLFSINALCSAVLIAFMNVDWTTLTPEKKLLIFVAIVYNWTTTIMAFASKQAARIQKTGQIFPDTGDTQFFVGPKTTNVPGASTPTETK